MYSVYLVEDEIFAKDMVKHLIAWEKYGFTISGEFANGAEAEKAMDKQLPDIVITDIVMPVLDGVELLRRSREAGWDSQFIMLTCMSEFTYAQQALELGAIGYVLKLSLRPERLIALLDKARAELEQRDKWRKLSTISDTALLAADRTAGGRTGHPQIDRIVDYISEHYRRDLTLGELARLVNMEQTYVSNLFKKKTGLTLTNFTQKVRIEAAVHQLLHTSLPVSAIAFECGFSNDNYFNKVFKRWTGKTPSDFRRS
ncbi:helix-turn-helix domain-containing protein [Paenibacillus albidus]|uniref:response regulator transcription factor n=1 Tax=Paenibacillus albidus TaxID=2041023 RepID=UPI001BE931AD|nr:helix-turn-helix domain-containing protein [Paenibacillus albidus]MBT2289692.1 helix-turn-helix domain-containing protein [Paenibacillus albidus]